MDKIEPRIGSARLPEKVDCLVYMAQKEMTTTQNHIRDRNAGVVWAEPYRLFDIGDSRFGLAQ